MQPWLVASYEALAGGMHVVVEAEALFWAQAALSLNGWEFQVRTPLRILGATKTLRWIWGKIQAPEERRVPFWVPTFDPHPDCLGAGAIQFEGRTQPRGRNASVPGAASPSLSLHAFRNAALCTISAPCPRLRSISWHAETHLGLLMGPCCSSFLLGVPSHRLEVFDRSV